LAWPVLSPWIAPYDPAQQFTDGLTLEGLPLPPSGRFWLGTDLLGRDLLTRLVCGVPAGARRYGEDGGQQCPVASGSRLQEQARPCADPDLHGNRLVIQPLR